MKTLLTLSIIILTSGIIHSQNLFTEVTSGPAVNDNEWGEGCAFGDYDNDGDQDLIVTTFNWFSPSSLNPILFYRNEGNGNFTKIITGAIATEQTRGHQPIWGDYDNDGDLDLFISTFNLKNLLFRNNGDGTFEKITSDVVVNEVSHSIGAAWLDYNKDGWLDLFVVNMYAENNFLYKNNGNGTFSKITNSIIANDGQYGYQCAVGDYDNNGYSDVFVVNWDGQSDRLYKNINGEFTLTSNVVPSDESYGHGAQFADVNNDGWLDLFVSIHDGYHPNYLNNHFYINNNGTSFTKINSGPGAQTGPICFGEDFLDYDNDGMVDLFVSNFGGNNFLYKNVSGSYLSVIGDPVTQNTSNLVGTAHADINNDGRLDLFLVGGGTSSSPSKDRLFLNTVQNAGNYIIIKLKGCTLNKSAIGARIELKAGGTTYTKEIGSGGYLSQDMLWQHFGVGNNTMIDEIKVKWTTGTVQVITSVPSNQYITIDECSVSIEPISNQIPNKYNLYQNYPNPFNPATKIKFDLPEKTFVKISIYDISGSEVGILVNSELAGGSYEVNFNAENLSSGVYFYAISTPGYTETKKMILLK